MHTLHEMGVIDIRKPLILKKDEFTEETCTLI